MNTYSQINGNAIKENETDKVLVRIDGCRLLENSLFGELGDEENVGITTHDVDISETNGCYCDGILVTLFHESDGESKAKCLDIVFSHVLGMFVSEWY